MALGSSLALRAVVVKDPFRSPQEHQSPEGRISETAGLTASLRVMRDGLLDWQQWQTVGMFQLIGDAAGGLGHHLFRHSKHARHAQILADELVTGTITGSLRGLDKIVTHIARDIAEGSATRYAGLYLLKLLPITHPAVRFLMQLPVFGALSYITQKIGDDFTNENTTADFITHMQHSVVALFQGQVIGLAKNTALRKTVLKPTHAKHTAEQLYNQAHQRLYDDGPQAYQDAAQDFWTASQLYAQASSTIRAQQAAIDTWDCWLRVPINRSTDKKRENSLAKVRQQFLDWGGDQQKLRETAEEVGENHIADRDFASALDCFGRFDGLAVENADTIGRAYLSDFRENPQDPRLDTLEKAVEWFEKAEDPALKELKAILSVMQSVFGHRSTDKAMMQLKQSNKRKDQIVQKTLLAAGYYVERHLDWTLGSTPDPLKNQILPYYMTSAELFELARQPEQAARVWHKTFEAYFKQVPHADHVDTRINGLLLSAEGFVKNNGHPIEAAQMHEDITKILQGQSGYQLDKANSLSKAGCFWLKVETSVLAKEQTETHQAHQVDFERIPHLLAQAADIYRQLERPTEEAVARRKLASHLGYHQRHQEAARQLLTSARLYAKAKQRRARVMVLAEAGQALRLSEQPFQMHWALNQALEQTHQLGYERSKEVKQYVETLLLSTLQANGFNIDPDNIMRMLVADQHGYQPHQTALALEIVGDALSRNILSWQVAQRAYNIARFYYNRIDDQTSVARIAGKGTLNLG